jgi:hypothetical protein
LLEEQSNPSHILVAIWAAELFYENNMRLPGELIDDDEERAQLNNCVNLVMSTIGVSPSSVNSDIVAEM